MSFAAVSSPPHWRDQLLASLQQSRQVEDWLPLAAPDQERAIAAKASFPMMVPLGYADLIDWQNPADPLRQLLLPSPLEDNLAGDLDTSGEEASTILPGLQHKYEQTAVLIVTQACAGHCRYCFRRRLMSRDVLTQETIEDLQEAIAYLKAHPEIDNVLLSGGDPMICHTQRLRNLFTALSPMAHLRQIRISSKLPAFLPSRFTTDPALLTLLQEFSHRFQIIVQCHFDHPREITAAARAALAQLRQAGCLLTAQIPLIKGVNNEADTLFQLFYQLHLLGVTPQYLFHPRPVKHATHFQLPILEGLRLVEAVRQRCNGSIKRFRYILTCGAGKVELVGLTSGQPQHLVIRWHQVRRGAPEAGVELRPLTPHQVWL
ncbi:KamA family radical SAM protein [Lyngbya confervoides]|uniref:KamA family radical SAM protein n=1 Tax=Lyngbya confervoides BDU141951 TaxID=1574623 RepID=A0ABD4SYY8_9CYAN|nr:KamA family radical SAM protein [Lyngbya confervoides]MCM1981631.1 KamA family radical SAM protein [Lyngbya confervoides BDU141951]